MTEIRAKPLQWTEEKKYAESDQEWSENRMGFHIRHDTDEPEDQQYVAAWGEGEPEFFATLDDAKAWCQSEADAWIRENAIIVV